MEGLETLNVASAELLLAALGMALLMFGVFRPAGGLIRISWLVVLGFVVAAVLVLTQDGTATGFGELFITDGFARFMKVLVLGAAALTLIIGLEYLEREDMNRFEYPVLCLFATLGMMLMISANNLISLYVGLELQSLSLYVMAAFRRDNLRSTEAGLKYFVLGALSSGMLLYGASLIYGFTGTTSFAGLASSLAAASGGPSIGVLVGLVFLCTGLAFKVSAVPFHMWTPDVYEGAPTPVTAFFAAAPKIAAFALFARVLMGPFGQLVDQWQQIVFVISLLSMVLGAVAAIAQTNIKRLMAYSSIGHVGYALVGLAAGTEEGLRGVAIYLAIYVVMNVGTFACILSMRVNGQMVEEISDLAGLSRAHPTMALVLAAMMFSMAGIPPLAGFFGKLYVFMAAVESGLYVLAVLGVLASVIGAFYYLRIVKVMYFDPATEPLDPVSLPTSLVLTVTGIAITFFVLFSAPVVDVAVTAAHAFAGG